MKTVAEFKDWYKKQYSIEPSEKLVDRFCQINGIEQKEEKAMIEPCSILKDVPTITTNTTAPVQQADNYKLLETNYNNLLAEFEEISAIASEQNMEIDEYAAVLVQTWDNIFHNAPVPERIKPILEKARAIVKGGINYA